METTRGDPTTLRDNQRYSVKRFTGEGHHNLPISYSDFSIK